jgi:hypothetical protein
MDLKHGDDIYDSFRAYQNKLLREYASMADEFHFRVSTRGVGRQDPDELRRQVAGVPRADRNRWILDFRQMIACRSDRSRQPVEDHLPAVAAVAARQHLTPASRRTRRRGVCVGVIAIRITFA